MLFLLVSVLVPIVTLICVPRIVERAHGTPRNGIFFLYSACLLFFISWYIPSPLIDGEDTAFITHLIGGGMFSGLLWLYIRSAFALRVNAGVEILLVFAVVSSLGVANELFELFAVRIGIAHIGLTDTNWDLLANTLGALGTVGAAILNRTYVKPRNV